MLRATANQISTGYYALIDRLARVTTSGRRFREVDGLRFIAIATVFVQHVYKTILLNYGTQSQPDHDFVAVVTRDSRIGVELFFMISGFILGLPFAIQYLKPERGRPVKLKQYFLRRITRLEPPYLLTLLLWFAVLVFYWHEPARPLLPHLLASALYVHNLAYKDFSQINAVAWSLEVEVQFYILAPLLATVFMIRNKVARRAFLLLGCFGWLQFLKLLRYYTPGVMALGGSAGTILIWLPMFMLGFLLADMFLLDWNENPTGSLWADCVAIPGWLVVLPLFDVQQRYLHHVILPSTAYPFLLFVLFWNSLRSVWVRKFLANSFVMTVGGMCYSIYLLHLPMLNILNSCVPAPILTKHLGANILLYSVIYSLPVLAASIVFFLLVEKPCMQRDWPIKLMNKFRLQRNVAAKELV